jgi:hypothetical protein
MNGPLRSLAVTSPCCGAARQSCRWCIAQHSRNLNDGNAESICNLLRMNVTLFGYTLIETAKINNVDPQAWMPEVLDPIADHKITRLDELVLWRYAQL